MELEEKKTIRHLFFHSQNLFLSRVSLAISGFLFWAVAARLYSVEEIGIGSALVSVVSFIVFISSLGVAPTFIRFLPEDKGKSQTLNTFLSLSFVLTLFLCVGLLLSVKYILPELGFLRNSFYPILFVFFAFCMLFFQISTGVLISLRLTRLVLHKEVIQNFGRIGFLFVFIWSEKIGILSSNSLGAVLSVAFVIILFRKRGYLRNITFKFNFGILKRLLPFSLVNFLNAASLRLPGSVFPLVIIAVFSERDAGFFYIPWLIFSVYCAFIKSILNVFLMESSYTKDKTVLLKRTSIYIFTLALIGFIGFYFWSDKILCIFNKEFTLYSLDILKTLFVSIFFFSLNQIYLTVKNIENDIRQIGVLSALILIGIVISSIFLLPSQGIKGVAISWLLANMAGNLYILIHFLIRKGIRSKVIPAQA